MVLWKIVFWSGNCHGKTWKIQYRRYNVDQNLFYALHVVDKSNVTSSIRGIWNGLCVSNILFFFWLSFSIGKRSTIAKSPPFPHPVSADLYDFNSERNYGVLKSKSPFFLLNKNKNFNKTRRIENRKFRAYF